MEPASINIRFNDGSEMLMSRRILAESSEYFTAVFRSGMKEIDVNCVNLTYIDAYSAKAVMNFLKYDDIQLDINNSMPILEASLYFEIASLQEKCFRYLSIDAIHHLQDILELSQQINKDRLAVLAFENAAMNFQTAINCRYRFSLGRLRRILASERLAVSDDYHFARYIVQFLADEIDDSPRRKALSLELMSYVRLCTIPIHCLLSLYQWTLVRKDKVLKMMIVETYLHHVKVTTKLPLKPYLIPWRTKLNIFACDKRFIEQVTSTWPNNQIKNKPDHQRKRFKGRGILRAAVWAFGFLYIFLKNGFFRFDPVWDRWVELAFLNTRLEKFCLIVFGNFIYKIGGQDGFYVSPKVERFSPRTNSWLAVCPLNTPICELSAVVYNKQLLINGGLTDTMAFSREVFIFEPVERKWRAVAPMNYGRYGHQSVVFGGQLYVFGGNTFELDLGMTSEVFNSFTDQWTILYFDTSLYFSYIWTEDDNLLAIERVKMGRGTQLARIDVQAKRVITYKEPLPFTFKTRVKYAVNRNS